MNTPVYDMLLKYSGSTPIPFHMPGHLLGKGLPDIFREAGKLDITEIPGSDCLHDPRGVIMEAQNLAADAFGAGKTLFLVNGSTAGIHAMIRAAVRPGGKILIGRDSHRSVANALALLGADPVFIMPEFDPNLNMTLGYSADSIEKTLEAYPEIEAVLLTRPNYFGVASKLEPIIEITRSHGIPLLVDEAHGAHFAFHKNLPKSSMASGADACVQSMHKTLPALTQTALLHVGKNSLLDYRRVEEQLSMIQTTSPSYVLMASMDVARDVMQRSGNELYDALYSQIERFESLLGNIRGVERLTLSGERIETDFSRIVLSFKECGLSGFEAEKALRELHGIYCEMADSNNIVLIATPYHSMQDFDCLLEGIRAVTQTKGAIDSLKACRPYPLSVPERRLSPGDAMRLEKDYVPLDHAAGMTSGGTITPYPPGIPLVYPGETISSELAGYAAEILDSGGSVHGIMDYKVCVIK